MHIMVALLDTDSHVIAINSLQAYHMYDETRPPPPKIELGEVGTGFAVLTIHDANPIDFKEFRLYRYHESTAHYRGHIVASTDNPHARFIVDDFAPSGHSVSYRVTVVGEDGRATGSSNSITADIPNDWVSTVDLKSPLIGDILLDPVRPVLYATDTHYNRIVRVSTLTDRVIDTLPSG